MLFWRTLGLLGLAATLSSCATVIRGSQEQLRVVSNPPGANVTLSSGETGVTPVSFIKNRRDSFQVTVSKAGYNTQSVSVVSRASGSGVAATAGNALTAGFGVAVDAGTGAWNSLYPNPVSVQLTALPPDPRLTTKMRKGAYPLGIATGQAGIVRSPYTQRVYDVHQVPHRALVHDLDVDKLFVNP
jgi:PEGA domain